MTSKDSGPFAAEDEAGLGGAFEGGAGTGHGSLPFEQLLADVPLELSVELGRVTMTLRDIGARLGPGSIIELDKLAGEALDVRVNERLVAHAEAVAVGERYGIRIVEIVGDKEAP